MGEILTIERIDNRTYALWLDGVVGGVIRHNDVVPGFPRCFRVIDDLYPAAKAACVYLPYDNEMCRQLGSPDNGKDEMPDCVAAVLF